MNCMLQSALLLLVRFACFFWGSSLVRPCDSSDVVGLWLGMFVHGLLTFVSRTSQLTVSTLTPCRLARLSPVVHAQPALTTNRKSPSPKPRWV